VTDDTDDGMLPESSPSGVVRFGNRPALILSAFGAITLGLLLYGAVKSADSDTQVTPSRLSTGSATSQTSSHVLDHWLAQYPSGVIPVAAPDSPAAPEDPHTDHSAEPAAGPAAPLPVPQPPGDALGSAESRPLGDPRSLGDSMVSTPTPSAELTRQHQEWRQAARSPMTVPISLKERRGDPAAQTGSIEAQIAAIEARRAELEKQDPTAAVQAHLGHAPSVPSPPSIPTQVAARDLNDISQFDRGSDRWTLTNRQEAPSSEYILQAGSVIPCVLDSAINSELAGPIVAHVATDVYDSITGRHRLFPQGTQGYGEYVHNVVYGQERLLVGWQRLKTPDGKVIDIGAMPGADGEGRAGFHDLVDTHFFRVMMSAILMAGVTSAVTLSQPPGRANEHNVRTVMSEQLGQQIGTVAAQMIAKNMAVAPTLDIRVGYRFNIVVTKDIELQRPYRARDYIQSRGPR
jgi:type IV secretion system protein TrbI